MGDSAQPDPSGRGRYPPVLPGGDRNAEAHELRDLWEELVLTLQAGNRLSSSDWRLCMRLNETSFEKTTLELSCRGGELSVFLRTASDAVYARLLPELPQLEQRLQSYTAAVGAVLTLVTNEELEA